MVEPKYGRLFSARTWSKNHESNEKAPYVYTPTAHVHVLGKRVHGHALVADDSTRHPRSVVLLNDVEDVPSITKQAGG